MSNFSYYYHHLITLTFLFTLLDLSDSDADTSQWIRRFSELHRNLFFINEERSSDLIFRPSHSPRRGKMRYLRQTRQAFPLRCYRWTDITESGDKYIPLAWSVLSWFLYHGAVEKIVSALQRVHQTKTHTSLSLKWPKCRQRLIPGQSKSDHISIVQNVTVTS